MVKVSNYTEREFIASLKHANSMSMLNVVEDGIVTALEESGEDSGEAREYVDNLVAKHIN